MRKLGVQSESWPLAKQFSISRGSKTEAQVVSVSVTENDRSGRGECLPYARYGESVESVIEALDAARGLIESGIDRQTLLEKVPAGAARNALDCALLDLECKTRGIRAWDLLNLEPPSPVVTAYTLSLDKPEAMAREATAHNQRRLLKLKLGPKNAGECALAVRSAAPQAMLIIDANEAWTIDQLEAAMDTFCKADVNLIEQPLPADADDALRGARYPIDIGADESCHTRNGIENLAEKYQVLNIKLDKTGGVTEALAMKRTALQHGLGIMVGCMVATSLSMAPAMLLTPGARFVDLDGPLLLARDRIPGLHYESDTVYPPEPDLWG